jgi:hypothetical protein
MDDHRQAMDIGQGLAGQPGRGHAGGDDDDGIVVFNHGLGRRRGKLLKTVLYVLRAVEKQLVPAGFSRGQIHGQFEFNKMAGAALGRRWWCSASSLTAIYHAETPEKPGFHGSGGSRSEAAGWRGRCRFAGQLLAGRSGEEATGVKACAACMIFQAAQQTGPAVGIVGRPRFAGFAYSEASSQGGGATRSSTLPQTRRRRTGQQDGLPASRRTGGRHLAYLASCRMRPAFPAHRPANLFDIQHRQGFAGVSLCAPLRMFGRSVRRVRPMISAAAPLKLAGLCRGPIIGIRSPAEAAIPPCPDPVHDIKYGRTSHFDYVNPAAPKGGRVRFGVIGSFDSLNPYTFKGNNRWRERDAADVFTR